MIYKCYVQGILVNRESELTIECHCWNKQVNTKKYTQILNVSLIRIILALII